MGSSPSTPRPSPVPSTSRLDTANSLDSPRRTNRQGFHEVELKVPENARSAPSAPSSTSRGNTPRQDEGPSRPQRLHEQASTSSRQPSTPGNRDRAKVDSQIEAADRHMVVGRLQRERTMAVASEFDLPKYKDDDIHFETFYHVDGREFRVIYQEGERCIIDTISGASKPFPKQLYSKGLLVTTDLPSDQPNAGAQAGLSVDQVDLEQLPNDRDGFIDHPTRGRIATTMNERKLRIHQYFDKEQGIMVSLPLSWELHSPLIKSLMKPVEETIPDWEDKYDMLATLRVCNYDPVECISTYFTVGETDVSHPKNVADAALIAKKDTQIHNLGNDVKSLQEKLNKMTESHKQELQMRKEAEGKLRLLQDKLATLEVDRASTAAKLESLQRDRPKTAASKRAAPVLDPNVLNSINQCTRSLHKSQISLQSEAKELFTSFKKMLSEVKVSFDKYRQCDSGVAHELEDMKELYRREALQRKLLYNQLQELRGNIRVFLRCRYDNRTKCCLQFPTDTDVLPPNSKKPYAFDKVFTPQSTQDEVYEDTRPIITSCVDGYNVCILAYGQTGSGKTFTMQGPSDDPGVNVRSLKDLLEICSGRDNVDYSLKASMVEIYNEAVHDLLSSSVNGLDIRAQGNKIVLPGMIEMPVRSIKDIDEIMKLGQKNRATASTKMNSQSSRSHLVFMVTVQGRDKSTGATSIGTLTLCDLAGSERVSKTEATGQRLAEAAAINKSLSSLGQVFTALRTGQLHVPYRNSKLTHILQPSLGGDAKACLFVMTSPDIENLPETMSTLQFGSNAQQVQLGQAKKNVTKG